jgi:Zn-dependent peptidase ImmA (M78 family)
MGGSDPTSRANEDTLMLADQSVEILDNESIEEAAERLLEQYVQFSGRNSLPVPVESIAEHLLGYDLEVTDEGLFSDPNFLGGISFETNTIFVNASVEEHEGRYTFTVAHEIGHHVLHKDLYDAHISDRSQILCRETNKKPLIERQADRFAAALVMPRALIRDSSTVKEQRRAPKTLPQAIHLANSVRAECGFSNVSLSALVNRLKDLSVISKEIPYQSGNRWRVHHRPSWKYVLLNNLRRIFFSKRR